jgi:hypothetical protein
MKYLTAAIAPMFRAANKGQHYIQQHNMVMTWCYAQTTDFYSEFWDAKEILISFFLFRFSRFIVCAIVCVVK